MERILNDPTMQKLREEYMRDNPGVLDDWDARRRFDYTGRLPERQQAPLGTPHRRRRPRCIGHGTDGTGSFWSLSSNIGTNNNKISQSMTAMQLFLFDFKIYIYPIRTIYQQHPIPLNMISTTFYYYYEVSKNTYLRETSATTSTSGDDAQNIAIDIDRTNGNGQNTMAVDDISRSDNSDE
ncbi:hypothetical protein BDB00DRAFT_879417 [Zychaea mexicana]|uniref:uncharacterized protein n=1 Tax=Zychaea mexicana TaxID=64656 RepID=UPI0022FE655C|nr:uncharacterized protein BDB00DRAFT_879417 [Zychaea mexicana]KAI9477708.1 hypothetical protein BDB00DRAFT_879417 [Zychaea mexicana]